MERWEPLKGYEKFYEISTCGRIKTLRGKKPKIMKLQKNSTGYLRVSLFGKRHFVHRLVAEQFIPHSADDNVVNHLDFNPLNNRVENLEWTTQLENMRYSYQNGRFVRTEEWRENLRKANEKNGHAVIGTPIDGGQEIFFICLNDTRLKGFQPSCVCNCCKGTRQKHKGYYWRYATNEERKQWGCG